MSNEILEGVMNHNVVGLAEIMEKATTGDHVKKGTKMNQLMIWIRAWIELADAIVCMRHQLGDWRNQEERDE